MDPKKTVLEVKVKSNEELRVQEKLVYSIGDKPLDQGFELRWDKTRVHVAIK
jgi:hypothetical protein